MKCQHVVQRLNAYADGELSSFRARRITRHIEGCPACRARWEGLKELGRLLDGWAMLPVPEGFADRLTAEARRKAPRTRKAPLLGQVFGWVLPTLREMSLSMRLAACGTALAAGLAGAAVAVNVAPKAHGEGGPTQAGDLHGLEWFGAAPPASLAAAYLAAPPRSGRGER
jgi:anti-sigma factor RsiW